MSFKIAIADDDHIICEGIKAIIGSSCPSTEIAGVFYNGSDLMNYIKQNHVDIVITDIQMSGFTGLEIAEYINKHYFGTNVILITGHKLFEYAKGAIDNKVCYFLIKPYDPDELIKAVNQIVSSLESSLAEGNINTNIYFNNWHHTKKKIIELYEADEPCDILTHEMFCTNTKTADELKARVAVFRCNNEKIASEIGDFDSIHLSSFAVKQSNGEFTLVMLYDSTDAADAFMEDIKKHAELVSSKISLVNMFDYNNFFELTADKNRKYYGSDDIVSLAIDYINRNYQDPDISLEKIAHSLHISKNYLGTLLKKRTGVRYNRYLMEVRVKKAKELLSKSDISVNRICNEIGLSNIDYFRNNFKELTGITPSEYRRKSKRNN